MIKTILLDLLLAIGLSMPLFSQIQGDPPMVLGGDPTFVFPTQVHRVTGNFPRDLFGPVDTRPNCYGHAEAAELPIKFNPPPGYQVRVLRLRGDLIAWAMGTGKKRGVVGLLIGFSNTGPEGSKQCDWCADNTLVYVQDGLSGKEVRRTPFDWDMGAVLGSDNVLVLKIATYLNTLDRTIHVEATWQADVEYVPIK